MAGGSYAIQGPTMASFLTLGELIAFYATNTAGNIAAPARIPVLPRAGMVVA